MFNDDLRDSSWRHIPAEIQHPWELPMMMQQHHTALLQTGPPQKVMDAGLEAGVFLTLNQLKRMRGILHFSLPGKGCGSGKSGRVTKEDYAKCLLKQTFPDKPEQEITRMLQAVMGKQWKHLEINPLHAGVIVSAFRSLNPEDQASFTKLAAVAVDEEKLQTKRLDRADGPHLSKLHETPRTLFHLLPKLGNCRITRHPVLKRYQCFFTAPPTSEDAPSPPA